MTISESKTVEKTKRYLRWAYLELLKKNRYGKISVNNLCKTAEISRTTFYLYYNDFEDFKKKTYLYVANKFAEQFSLWCAELNGDIDSVCSKKNLIIDEVSRELVFIFSDNAFNLEEIILFNSECFRVCKCKLENTLYDDLYKKFPQKTDFFFRGFFSCAIKLMGDYSSKRARNELHIISDMFFTLFN